MSKTKNAAVKREQSQTSLNSAEREQGRRNSGNVVIDQQNQQKQESDFAKAVSDLQEHVSLETLDRLHSACHEAIKQLQGDMRLPEAAGRYDILSHILTVELVAFKAYARKYTQQHNDKSQTTE